MVRLDWNDPVKELARRELRNAIIHLYGKDRRNLTVIHLPGGSDLEYERVYKSLGINPSGIVGIERDPDVYKFLERRGVPYELYYGSLEEFMASTTRRFDIISADTTELFGQHQLIMIMNIFQREVLKDRGILHTVFAAKRDKIIHKLLYEGSIHSSLISSLLSLQYKFDTRVFSEIVTLLMPQIERAIELYDKSMSLPMKRSLGIIEFIRGVASDGVPYSENLQKLLNFEQVFNYEKRSEGGLPDELNEELKLKLLVRSSHNLLDNLIYEIFKSHNLPKFIPTYLILSHRKPSYLELIKRYKYITEDGFQMYGDILGLDRKTDIYSRVPITLEGIEKNEKFDFSVQDQSHMLRVRDMFLKSAFDPLPSRVELKI